MSEFKPCPFCGGEPYFYAIGSAGGEVPPCFVACTDCGANVHHSQWNERPSDRAMVLEEAARECEKQAELTRLDSIVGHIDPLEAEAIDAALSRSATAIRQLASTDEGSTGVKGGR